MANTTPPALAVTPTLPVLTFNFEQLKAWAADLANHYANIVVTEDAIADVKRDMAELNKAKKAVDDARKETVRRVSEPIRTFEAQIKEVCGIFDSAYSALGAQVKAFEGVQRADKRVVVEGLIEEAIKEITPRPVISMQEKWLNKTTSIKAIREDIAAIIFRHIEEEQRKVALEQARQDRAAAIETHVKTLNQQYGLDMPVARFLHGWAIDPSTPLADVLKRIGETFDHEREQQAKKGASVSPVINKPVCESDKAESEPQAPPAQPASHEAKTRAMSIVFEFSTVNEKEVQDCLATLKSLCISFGARCRQE